MRPKLSDIKPGDMLVLTEATPCLEIGPKPVKEFNGALYVECNGGDPGTGMVYRHFLDEHADDDGRLELFAWQN